MTRQERIQDAERRLEELRPEYERITNEYLAALGAKKQAEASFDIGERVEVRESCKRGCCTEREFVGVVESVNANSTYNIRQALGELIASVYAGHMRRREG